MARLHRTLVFLLALLVLAFTGPWAGAAIDESVNPVPTEQGRSGTISGTPSGPLNTSIGTVFIGANFTGSTLGQSRFIPPDTMGAVGPDHIVELINGRYAVYDKAGNFQSATSLDTFWTDAGVNFTNFTFDPRILYDPATSRYYAAAVDNNGGANNILLAVSNASDPTAGWSGMAIDSSLTNTAWADFPTLGLSGGRVTVAADMFSLVGRPFTTSVFSIDKADLIGGNSAAVSRFEEVNTDLIGRSVQPVHDLTATDGTQHLISATRKFTGQLKLSDLSGPVGSPALNTSGGTLGVIARGDPPNLDQPGTAADAFTGGTRFSANAVRQQIPGRASATVFAAHAVNLGGRAAVEWYEIDPDSDTVLQSGTISDPSLGFAYPSIAVNADGDMVIGFSGSDDQTFISTYAVVGETVNGVTTFSDPILLGAGEEEYERLDGASRNRWGDYSSTVIDPNNPEVFWTFQLYASAPDGSDLTENIWAAQITQITVPEPASGAVLLFTFAALTVRRRSA